MGVVYIAKAANGDVLYVGKSLELFARLASHKRQSGWWSECSTIELRHVEQSKLDWVEQQTIRSLRPVWNIRHNEQREAC